MTVIAFPRRHTFRKRLALALLALAVPLGSCTIAPPDDAGEAGASGSQAVLVDRVTRVRDGDTLVVGLIPIRIANLDCAESGTIAGEAATRRAKQLVSGHTLACRLEGRRSYDREVGVCSLPDGRDFGEVLIAEGFCGRWQWR